MDELEAILETGGAAAVEIAASSLAERGAKVPNCPNCGKPLIGPFCAICGQPRDTHRRSVWGLIKVLVEDIISFDSRIMRTGWALVTKPGELARAFREGRTQRYLPALRLYLFTSLIFFVVLGATNIALLQLVVTATPTKVTWIKGEPYIANPAYSDSEEMRAVMPKMVKIPKEKASRPGGLFSYSSKIYFFSPIGAYHTSLSAEARKRLEHPNFDVEIDSDRKATPAQKKKAKEELNGWFSKRIFGGMRRLASDPAALNGSLTAWIPRVLFLLMPLYALLLALFYVRQRRKFFFVDHLIFSLTIHTFGFVLLLAAAGAAQLLPGEAVAWSTLIVATVYTFLAMHRFYEQNWFWTGIKFVTVSFFYMCFCALPALGVVLALSFLNI
jgi:hypothetical protein